MFGIGFYAFYRSLYQYVIRKIEIKTIGIPQYEFHLSVAKRLKAPKKVKTITVASACLHHVLETKAKQEFREQNAIFNSFVHALFMTSFIFILFLIHDIIVLSQKFPWIWLWSLAIIFFFVAGIGLDKQADSRETLFLQNNLEEYEKNLKTYIY